RGATAGAAERIRAAAVARRRRSLRRAAEGDPRREGLADCGSGIERRGGAARSAHAVSCANPGRFRLRALAIGDYGGRYGTAISPAQPAVERTGQFFCAY